MADTGFGGPTGGRPQIDPALIQRVIQRRRRGGPAGGKPAFPPQGSGIPPGLWRLQQGLIGSPKAQANAQQNALTPRRLPVQRRV